MSDIAEEQYCLHMLKDLRERYEREAKPFVDRLIAIKRREIPRHIVKRIASENDINFNKLMFAEDTNQESLARKLRMLEG